MARVLFEEQGRAGPTAPHVSGGDVVKGGRGNHRGRLSGAFLDLRLICPDRRKNASISFWKMELRGEGSKNQPIAVPQLQVWRRAKAMPCRSKNDCDGRSSRPALLKG